MQAQQRALPTAIAAPVEIVALPEVFSVIEKANLPALQAALQFSELWQEAAVLQRLCYKNRNQHRASKHHQAIAQVCKSLKLFQQLQLQELLQELHNAAMRTSLPAAAAAAADVAYRSSKRRQQHAPSVAAAAASEGRQSVKLPSFQAGCFVARRLLCGCNMLLCCYDSVITTAQHLSGQLSRGYFMPFCLVTVACAARIRVLVIDALMQLVQTYNALIALLPLLPAQPPTCTSSNSSGGSNPAFGINDEGLPQLVNLAWQNDITPKLNCIDFDATDNISSRAAGFQETFCISWPAGSSRTHITAAATMNATAGDIDMIDAAAASAAAGGCGGDVGVSIGREEFERLMRQQQQQQQGGLPRARPSKSRSTTPSAAAAAAAVIPVFEDKQPAKPSAAAAAAVMPGQQQHDAPKYITTGFGLGLGFGHQQQQQQGLGTWPGQQPPGLVQQQQHTGSAAAADQAAAAMDVDEQSHDRAEYEELYGQTEHAVAAADVSAAAAAVLQGPVGLRQQQTRGAFTAALAMQGHSSSSSSDDEDGDGHQQQQQQATLPASTAAVLAVQWHGSSSSSDDDGKEATAAKPPVQSVQQQQRHMHGTVQGGNLSSGHDTAAAAQAPADVHVVQQPQTQQQPPPGQPHQAVTVQAVEGLQQRVLPAAPAAAAAAQLTMSEAVPLLDSKEAPQQQPQLPLHYMPQSTAAAAVGKYAESVPATTTAIQQQQRPLQSVSQSSSVSAAVVGRAPLLASKKATRREAAKQRQQQQQQCNGGAAVSTGDWALDILTGSSTQQPAAAATATAGRNVQKQPQQRRQQGRAAAQPAAAAAAADTAGRMRTANATNAMKVQKGRDRSGSSSSNAEGGAQGSGGGCAAGARDPILDMLLGDL